MADIYSFRLWPGWTVDEKIGQGTFGIVYKAHMTRPDGSVVYAAIKHIPIPARGSENDLQMDTP